MRNQRAGFAGLLLVLTLPACAGRPAPPATGALTWIEDDAPRALDEAKRRAVPVFVEAWAPW